MKANQLSPDFKEFVELLNAHKVEYLIVGAFAVARYGVVRNTGDIDVWIRQTPDNAARLVQVLADFGFASLGYTVADFMETDVIVQIGVPPFRIDVLTVIDGVSFDECYPNRQESVLDGVPLAVISIHACAATKPAPAAPKTRKICGCLTREI